MSATEAEHEHTNADDSWLVWNDDGEVKSGLNENQAQAYIDEHGKNDEGMYAECSECAEILTPLKSS